MVYFLLKLHSTQKVRILNGLRRFNYKIYTNLFHKKTQPQSVEKRRGWIVSILKGTVATSCFNFAVGREGIILPRI